jgi:hypothetical protein
MRYHKAWARQLRGILLPLQSFRPLQPLHLLQTQCCAKHRPLLLPIAESLSYHPALRHGSYW